MWSELVLRCYHREHAIRDLKPYVSTHPDKDPGVFDDKRLFLAAEVAAYYTTDFCDSPEAVQSLYNQNCGRLKLPKACMFCKRSTGETARHYVRHIGRHMEEIALAVVPKDYVGWKFCPSDSSDEEL
ncbi:MAG: hypothetical protein Q9226_009350, partial [Calogaya cf. arnoldii]